jgi:hypothetical protein
MPFAQFPPALADARLVPQEAQKQTVNSRWYPSNY